eukprot:4536848-Amphidinium_carterae.1
MRYGSFAHPCPLPRQKHWPEFRDRLLLATRVSEQCKLPSGLGVDIVHSLFPFMKAKVATSTEQNMQELLSVTVRVTLCSACFRIASLGDQCVLMCLSPQRPH